MSPLFGSFALRHVEDGAEVTLGDALGEVEAMKTFTRFVAPCDGVLAWKAELGEIVGEGDVLAEIV